MTQRKSTGLLVSVVLATATFGIGPKVRAAPHCDMEHTRVGLDGVLYRVEYEGGAGASTPEVPAELISLTEFLDGMEEALADSVAETGDVPGLDVGEPFYLVAQPEMEASSVVALPDHLGGVATGAADIKAYPNSGSAALTLELTEGEITRILDQVLSRTDGVLTSWGTLMIDDGSRQITTLTGRWTYSQAEGAVVAPNSDPGFIDALAAMLLVSDDEARREADCPHPVPRGNADRQPASKLVDRFYGAQAA